MDSTITTQVLEENFSAVAGCTFGELVYLGIAVVRYPKTELATWACVLDSLRRCVWVKSMFTQRWWGLRGRADRLVNFSVFRVSVADRARHSFKSFYQLVLKIKR